MKGTAIAAFWHGFVAGTKDGPRLFFAPVAGAIIGVRRALNRPL